MGRNKATMKLIGSRSVRHTTLKKRRSSILKKASELTKLCGKPVCLVVSDGPDDSSPVVWPSQEEAEQMLSMAKSMPEGNQKKKKLEREVAEIREQVQNQDQENLHLEAMLQMQLKEVLRRIDSQLTITPLSVALESSMVQPPILEDGEHLIMMPIHEEGMLLDYETMPGSFDPFVMPSISMPALFDAPNVASGGGGIIQTQSLNAGATYACACGGEEKERMQWDEEHLEPIFEEECLSEDGEVKESMHWDGEHLEPIFMEDCLPYDGEPLTPILDKYKLMDYLNMFEPVMDLETAGHEASLPDPEQHIVDPVKMPGNMSDAPNESGGIFSAVVASSSERCGTSCRASADVAPVPEGSDVHSLDNDFDDVLSSFFKKYF